VKNGEMKDEKNWKKRQKLWWLKCEGRLSDIDGRYAVPFLYGEGVCMGELVERNRRGRRVEGGGPE
jgi:hypothetical protein